MTLREALSLLLECILWRLLITILGNAATVLAVPNPLAPFLGENALGLIPLGAAEVGGPGGCGSVRGVGRGSVRGVGRGSVRGVGRDSGSGGSGCGGGGG